MGRFVISFALFASVAAAAEPSGMDLVRQAVEVFQEAKSQPERFRDAAAIFAKAARNIDLTADQQAAWAYCRVRLAAEDWNASKGDAAVAKRVVAEVADALKLAPDYVELQKFGRDVIVAAGGTPPALPKPRVSVTSSDAGWYSLETENFRIRYPAAAKEFADLLAAKVEEHRAAIFTRWSGPSSAAWSPKCEVVVHASANDFAQATGQLAAATGHALIQLDQTRPSLRRIDLRADDESAAIDALPREMTHIILADLFPATPPPRWAADGMAALAMSPLTVDRYLKTARVLANKNELPAASTLLESKSAPAANQITGHLVGSAVLVDYLVRLKGERSLTIFLRDTQRYGLEKSLDRQFGFASFKAIDAAFAKETR